jgi:tetratricopeptide (TPR) repeat protein
MPESGREGELATLMDQAFSDDGSEARALANVKRGLFGETPRPPRPVMLSRYVLLERIGVGGLGVVYAGYDPELDRRVAIKLVRARRRGSAGSRERLVREAQAMAKLAHPHVITVHDVGTYGGPEGPAGPPGVESEGVFVVMEHVAGAGLDAWLAQGERAWHEIVDVLVAAGRGLVAAHAAGLVHRDFKPSNVLVGNDGRVRVLDFGLARTDATASEASPPSVDEDVGRESVARAEVLTRTGGLLGTPAYMAPEQHDGVRADARADQYSFCVTLWEALYGARPFAGATLDELAQAKRAAVLPAEPPRVQVPRRIHDALVRGLAADPEARHPSLAALLRTLERRPGARRLWAAAAVGIGIFAGAWMLARSPASPDPCEASATLLSGVWDEDIRGEASRAFAATELPFAAQTWATVAGELDDYAARMGVLRQEVCAATHVHETQPVAVMERRNACLDRGLEALARVGSLFATADAAVVVHAVEVTEQLPVLDACLEPWADAAASEMAMQDRGRLEHALTQAGVLRAAGRYGDAEAQAADAVATARASEHPGGLARALLTHGVTLLDNGKEEEAERELFDAIATAERAGDEATAASALVHVARHLVAQARTDEAERLLAMAAAKIERHGLQRTLGVELLHAEGDLSRRRGRVREALDTAREVLAAAEARYDPRHTEVARARTRVALGLHETGDTEGAVALLERAHEAYVARLGPDHPHVAETIGLLANLDDDRGAYAKGLERHRDVVETLGRVYGPSHLKVAQARVNLAASLMAQEQREEALAELGMAAEAYEAAGKSEHVDMALILVNMSTIERERGELEAARKAGDRAVELSRRAFGEEHPQTAMAMAVRAQAMSAQGRHADAIDDLTTARERVRDVGGDDHPLVGMLGKALGEARLASGDRAGALQSFEEAVRVLELRGGDVRELVTARIAIARERASEDPQEARTQLLEARRAWTSAGHDWDRLVRDEAWIEPLLRD